MQGLVIAPNPVAQGENAKINVSENAIWEVYTIAGSLVARGNGNQLTTATLVAGSYIVKVTDNNTLATTQLIIK